MRGTGTACAERAIRKVGRKELYCNGGAVVRGKDGTVKNSMHTEALFLATSREGMGRGRPQRAWELFCYEQRMPIMYVCMYAAVAELAPDSRNGKGEGAGKDLVRSHLFCDWQPIEPIV